MAATDGGQTLTITGSNFGALTNVSPRVANVTVGSVTCPIVSSNHTTVLCTAPAGTGLNQAVLARVDGQASNSFTGFSYGAPTIANVTGCVDIVATGTTEECAANTRITVTGAAQPARSVLVLSFVAQEPTLVRQRPRCALL